MDSLESVYESNSQEELPKKLDSITDSWSDSNLGGIRSLRRDSKKCTDSRSDSGIEKLSGNLDSAKNVAANERTMRVLSEQRSNIILLSCLHLIVS